MSSRLNCQRPSWTKPITSFHIFVCLTGAAEEAQPQCCQGDGPQEGHAGFWGLPLWVTQQIAEDGRGTAEWPSTVHRLHGSSSPHKAAVWVVLSARLTLLLRAPPDFFQEGAEARLTVYRPRSPELGQHVLKLPGFPLTLRASKDKVKGDLCPPSLHWLEYTSSVARTTEYNKCLIWITSLFWYMKKLQRSEIFVKESKTGHHTPRNK